MKLSDKLKQNCREARPYWTSEQLDKWSFFPEWWRDAEQLEKENKYFKELVAFRRELLDYDDKRILELSTENTRLKEQCARLEQEYIRMFNQLYKED